MRSLKPSATSSNSNDAAFSLTTKLWQGKALCKISLAITWLKTLLEKTKFLYSFPIQNRIVMVSLLLCLNIFHNSSVLDFELVSQPLAVVLLPNGYSEFFAKLTKECLCWRTFLYNKARVLLGILANFTEQFYEWLILLIVLKFCFLIKIHSNTIVVRMTMEL